ncbi:hypothetical protein ACIBK8_15555 [Streptomyces sp. NPDC050161]|uniref:hypothetical protein n=1 Tax=Streptomyces sp. NPDC050161 TaxID=3365604 RepID=UPI0037ABAF02
MWELRGEAEMRLYSDRLAAELAQKRREEQGADNAGDDTAAPVGTGGGVAGAVSGSGEET